MSTDFRTDFLHFAIERQVLRFGEFTTKAGRRSPYFFNAGLFHDGASLARLGQYYALAMTHSSLSFDMLFGPAYKGIPLVASVAIAMLAQGRNLPYCFNRKEAKDHGEGGSTVGAPLQGRVLVVDDVISAGTSVRESLTIIRAHGAEPAGVVIALDRQERGSGALSAVQEVEQQHGLPVVAIATLADLLELLEKSPELGDYLLQVQAYRAAYGIAGDQDA